MDAIRLAKEHEKMLLLIKDVIILRVRSGFTMEEALEFTDFKALSKEDQNKIVSTIRVIQSL